MDWIDINKDTWNHIYFITASSILLQLDHAILFIKIIIENKASYYYNIILINDMLKINLKK